ncbi:gastrula zinc finger protein xFG20-1-like [Mercenaria mercenaria]|uniref:gastrula zinc finger protein xFG20-1-like n=1 Tax=Mercenaria mercenaria TaxID=6596 RepID=UPI00234F8BEB|nr:gastrula zinc finger protein xFG20-1-like [Mercenaria mercenaria]
MDVNDNNEDWWASYDQRYFDQDALDKELSSLEKALGVNTNRSEEKENANTSKGFLCKNCGAKFSRAFTLKHHQQRNVCGKKRHFNCQHCGKSFLRQEYLKQHENKRKCDRGTLINRVSNIPTASTSEESLVSVPLEKIKRFHCDRCNGKFARKFNLDRHIKRNTCTSNGIDRVFTCRICSKTFSSPAFLKKNTCAYTQRLRLILGLMYKIIQPNNRTTQGL